MITQPVLLVASSMILRVRMLGALMRLLRSHRVGEMTCSSLKLPRQAKHVVWTGQLEWTGLTCPWG